MTAMDLRKAYVHLCLPTKLNYPNTQGRLQQFLFPLQRTGLSVLAYPL